MHKNCAKIHYFPKSKCFPDFITKTVTIENVPNQFYLLTNPHDGMIFSSE